MAILDMSRPLAMHCVFRLYLLHMSFTDAIAMVGTSTPESRRLFRISVASSELSARMSLKRWGEGVTAGDGSPVVENKLLPFKPVVGVVKTSSESCAGVAKAISPYLLFPGVERVSVFTTFLGVSGGGIDTWSTTFASSSSSLAGQSKNSSAGLGVLSKLCAFCGKDLGSLGGFEGVYGVTGSGLGIPVGLCFVAV